MNIIKEILEQAEVKIEKEIAKCNELIQDFTKPLPKPFTRKDIEERQTGRLSVSSLEKAYKDKFELEEQISKIIEFKFYHKELYEKRD